jgi:hypothetical protein
MATGGRPNSITQHCKLGESRGVVSPRPRACLDVPDATSRPDATSLRSELIAIARPHPSARCRDRPPAPTIRVPRRNAGNLPSACVSRMRAGFARPSRCRWEPGCPVLRQGTSSSDVDGLALAAVGPVSARTSHARHRSLPACLLYSACASSRTALALIPSAITAPQLSQTSVTLIIGHPGALPHAGGRYETMPEAGMKEPFSDEWELTALLRSTIRSYRQRAFLAPNATHNAGLLV